MNETIDAQWLKDTLLDVQDALSEALNLLEKDSRHAKGVLEHEIPEIYAKLNYAVNTATTGAPDLDTVDHNALIAWPKGNAFKAFSAKESRARAPK